MGRLKLEWRKWRKTPALLHDFLKDLVKKNPSLAPSVLKMAVEQDVPVESLWQKKKKKCWNGDDFQKKVIIPLLFFFKAWLSFFAGRYSKSRWHFFRLKPMEVCQSPYTPFCLGGYYFSYCTYLEYLENASVSKQLGSNIPVLGLTCIFKPLMLEVMEFCEDTVTKTPGKWNSSPLKNGGWKMVLFFWHGMILGANCKLLGCNTWFIWPMDSDQSPPVRGILVW